MLIRRNRRDDLLIVLRDNSRWVECVHDFAFELNLHGARVATLVSLLRYGDVAILYGVLNSLNHKVIPVARPILLLVFLLVLVLFADVNVPV